MVELVSFLWPCWRRQSLMLFVLSTIAFASLDFIYYFQGKDIFCVSDVDRILVSISETPELFMRKWCVFCFCGVVFSSTMAWHASVFHLSTSKRFYIFSLIHLLALKLCCWILGPAPVGWVVLALFLCSIACSLMVRVYTECSISLLLRVFLLLVGVTFIHPLLVLCFVALFKFRALWVCAVNGNIKLYRFLCMWGVSVVAVVFWYGIVQFVSQGSSAYYVLLEFERTFDPGMFIVYGGFFALFVFFVSLIVSCRVMRFIFSYENRYYWWSILICLFLMLCSTIFVPVSMCLASACLLVFCYVGMNLLCLSLIVPSGCLRGLSVA